ncbi:hypothetical protein CapIbe_005296 [Capra ibex]
MSLLARRHWRCAGHGRRAPGPRVHGLRIAFACHWGAEGARAGSRRTVRERACGGFGHLCTGTRGGRARSAPSPPLHHHFGDPSGSGFGVPTDF